MTSTPPSGGFTSTNLSKTESPVCTSCGAATGLLRTCDNSSCTRRICFNCLSYSSRSCSNCGSRTFPNVREAVARREMDAIPPAPVQYQQNQPASQPLPLNVEDDQVVPQIEDSSD